MNKTVKTLNKKKDPELDGLIHNDFSEKDSVSEDSAHDIKKKKVRRKGMLPNMQNKNN